MPPQPLPWQPRSSSAFSPCSWRCREACCGGHLVLLYQQKSSKLDGMSLTDTRHTQVRLEQTESVKIYFGAVPPSHVDCFGMWPKSDISRAPTVYSCSKFRNKPDIGC